jgi:hypothetical protein
LVWFGYFGENPIWLGFSSGFFYLGSAWFFQFQAYKTKTKPVGFFKILIGLIGFFKVWFFGYFFCFLSLIGFLNFLLTPIHYYTTKMCCLQNQNQYLRTAQMRGGNDSR